MLLCGITTHRFNISIIIETTHHDVGEHTGRQIWEHMCTQVLSVLCCVQCNVYLSAGPQVGVVAAKRVKGAY